MTDVLTEELAAIRLIRAERLRQLLRDLEEGRLNPNREPGTRGSSSHLANDREQSGEAEQRDSLD
jgi:hypothetical protein